jgi:hypothetical protein
MESGPLVLRITTLYMEQIFPDHFHIPLMVSVLLSSNYPVEEVINSILGTAIFVKGTTHPLNIPAGAFDPSWECFVDNISIGATKPRIHAENNQLLCEQKGLVDTLHELTVNVHTTGQTFWFDRIQYTPSPRLSSDNAVFLVDNNDIRMVFDSNWFAIRSPNDTTQTPGSTAKFLFNGMCLLRSHHHHLGLRFSNT